MIQAASRAVPIVFAQAIDPVGAGSVASLARPGGNVTGFMQFEYSLSGKCGLVSYGPDLDDQYRRGELRRSHPQGREARRPVGAGADQV
jgi:hypothetical protein